MVCHLNRMVTWKGMIDYRLWKGENGERGLIKENVECLESSEEEEGSRNNWQ